MNLDSKLKAPELFSGGQQEVALHLQEVLENSGHVFLVWRRQQTNSLEGGKNEVQLQSEPQPELEPEPEQSQVLPLIDR